MADAPPPIHPEVEPLAFLLGTWRGEGRGEYPTIEPFTYVEEITFGHVGKPFLAYHQRTRHGETDARLHAETGYWRPVSAAEPGDGAPEGRPGATELGIELSIELLLAHPTGILECLVGPLTADDEGRPLIELRCTPVLSPTAKSVTETRRTFTVDGDTLRYDMSMAAVGHPLTHHLSARLSRT